MLDQVQAAVTEIGQRYRDPRTHYFKVEAVQSAADQFVLTGAVLDAECYLVVADELLARFPDICFDAAGVQVLRSPTPQVLSVATNLAGLHAEPSFFSEMVSQLLNGAELELLVERDRWALVRQPDGYLGWAYRPYLSPTPAAAPTHIVRAPAVEVFSQSGGALQGRLLGGTMLHVAAEAGDRAHFAWQLNPGGVQKAWVACSALRSLAHLPQDEPAQRRRIVEDAEQFYGVPYLWGGCTAYGIDCSGFAQLVHRLSGVEIPRDADMQFAAGRPAPAPCRPGDLLFFGDGTDPTQHITHVGVSLGGWHILHSSRSCNGVYADDVQRSEGLRGSFAGAVHSSLGD